MATLSKSIAQYRDICKQNKQNTKDIRYNDSLSLSVTLQHY